MIEIVGEPRPNRRERVEKLAAMGFTWADLGNEAYWVDQLAVMPASLYEELRNAAGALWTIFDKAARFVVGRRDLYELLAVPEVLWDALDVLEPGPEGLISRYARFDFAISPAGDIRLLELNADTPTGYVEASVVTPWMCRQYGVMSANDGMKARIAEAWQAERPEVAACMAYGEHAEDTGTIEMLVRHSGLPVRCLDCLELWVDEGQLKDAAGMPIHSLFALYPKEWMAVDDGGEALAFALESGKLQLFNPVHAILLQSKGLQALIWGLHELMSGLFTREEHAIINRYMLPTYDQPVLEHSYVSKSMFGREGGSVKLYDEKGQLETEDRDGYDTSVWFPPIYQQRAELHPVKLYNGDYHLLAGMFMLNGQPSGLLGRAGGLITGNASHFIAIGVKEK
ncbi:glutathionylspermidine synthase [Xylanibacillus composti]|uniref:Glutathionylspermidine synthase n=1 Tax=Xylanibacillus composti TaxID=1572762 RepID=A0A8J4M2Z7_9BACL|nr:glutathionylspermidine synthase family protein [Xylanibacillus composti]MDT9724591.1 glutathionylspermidine synthase [Xylanibacillus composti]GIQ70249.1 glutathionylspermidine synthase [Xylanibacillus composti]